MHPEQVPRAEASASSLCLKRAQPRLWAQNRGGSLAGRPSAGWWPWAWVAVLRVSGQRRLRCWPGLEGQEGMWSTVGEGSDCLTCTSFSWGGSVEKEELGVQQTLLIQKCSIPAGPCPTLNTHFQGGPSLLRLWERPLCSGSHLCGSPFPGELLLPALGPCLGNSITSWPHIVPSLVPQPHLREQGRLLGLGGPCSTPTRPHACLQVLSNTEEEALSRKC